MSGSVSQIQQVYMDKFPFIDATGNKQELRVDIKHAASEATLLKILDELKKKSLHQHNPNNPTSSTSKTFNSLNKSASNLNRGLDDLEEETDNATKATKNYSGAVKSAMTHLAAALTGVAGGTGFGLLHTALSVTSKGLGSLGTGISAVGAAALAVPNIFANFVGGVLTVFGATFKPLAEGIAVAGGFLIAALELQYKRFNDLSSAGALFEDSMQTLAEWNDKTSQRQSNFVDVIKKNSAAFAAFGTVASGAKVFANVISGLGSTTDDTSLMNQLRRLGYSFDDINQSAADMMTQFADAGRARTVTELELRNQTVNYLKNLKLVSAITGQTAEQEEQKIRAQRQSAKNQLLYAQIRQEAGPGREKIVDQLMATLTPAQQAALLQEKTGVLDSTGQVGTLYQMAPEMQGIMKQLASMMGDTSVGLPAMLELAQKAAKSQASLINPNSTAGIAALAGVDIGPVTALMNETANAADGLRRFASADIPEAVAQIRKLMDENTTTMSRVIQMNNAMEAIASTLENVATRLIDSNVANRLVTAFTDIINGLVDIAKNLSHTALGRSIAGYVGTALGAVGGGLAGTVAATPGFGTAAGAVTGGMAGKSLGEWFYDALSSLSLGSPADAARAIDWEHMGQYAKGGIASGPQSGYKSMLHGVEAVVPLPDNRSIPVDLNTNNDDIRTTRMQDESLQSAKKLLEQNDQLLMLISTQNDLLAKIWNVNRENVDVNNRILINVS